MEVTTKSGFSCTIEPEVFDDWELLEAFQAVDEGDTRQILKIVPALLGEKQTEALKNHIKKEHGRVKISEMISSIHEIMEEAKGGKNS